VNRTGQRTTGTAAVPAATGTSPGEFEFTDVGSGRSPD